jgi:hypothetical protein
MAEVVQRVDDTTKVFTAILVLGLVGLLFLIIFGNLSGNLGFVDVTNITANETGHNITGDTNTLAQASSLRFVSLAVNNVFNASNGIIVGTGNYTVDSTAGTIVGTAGRTENYTVNITYTTTLIAEGEQDTNEVINNLTAGANTFFTFSNVWFTLLAIVLLIIIVMSVIAIVSKKGSNFSS